MMDRGAGALCRPLGRFTTGPQLHQNNVHRVGHQSVTPGSLVCMDKAIRVLYEHTDSSQLPVAKFPGVNLEHIHPNHSFLVSFFPGAF